LLKSKKLHNQEWFAKAVAAYGDRLHALIKLNTCGPSWKHPYCGFPPMICKENQRRAIARREVRKNGGRRSDLPRLLPVPKPWLSYHSNMSTFLSNLQQPSGFFPVSFGGGSS